MILSLTKDPVTIQREQDLVLFRNRVKEMSLKIKMSVLNQTRLITASSEIVRNMLRYAEGGIGLIEVVSRGRDNGIRLTFTDKGPGIADINMAMRDGYSTGRSLGLGLPGSKRLVDEFDIKSKTGEGTMVMLLKWAK
jgi:serine/threonine-protein kinase RsbT